MDIAVQKSRILIFLGILIVSQANAAELRKCSSAPLMVTSKKVGNVSYFAEDCQKNWQSQSIKMDFSYNRDIPEWAFKRAATHFLKKMLAALMLNLRLIILMNYIGQLRVEIFIVSIINMKIKN